MLQRCGGGEFEASPRERCGGSRAFRRGDPSAGSLPRPLQDRKKERKLSVGVTEDQDLTCCPKRCGGAAGRRPQI